MNASLIHHEYRGVTKHIPMPMSNRAAQFSPFAALTGYDDVISEESRVTEERRYPAEGLTDELDEVIRTHIASPLELTYFVPDGKKRGGEYVTIRGRIKRIIPESGVLVMENGSAIRLSAIMDAKVLQES